MTMDRKTRTTPLQSREVSDDQIRLLHDALTLMDTLKFSHDYHPVQRTDWQRLLDYLAWLCDFKRGGETVVSIAAEQVAEGSRFWISSNSSRVQQSAAHLRLVLSRLASLRKSSPARQEEVAEVIYSASITFSRLRVHDYCLKLKRFLINAEEACCDISDHGW